MKHGQEVKIVWKRENKTYGAKFIQDIKQDPIETWGRKAPYKGYGGEEFPLLFYIPYIVKHSKFPSENGKIRHYKMFVNKEMTKGCFSKSQYANIFTERTLTRLPCDNVKITLED